MGHDAPHIAWVTCRACDGTGRIDNTPSNCRACRGHKRLPADLTSPEGRRRYDTEIAHQFHAQVWIEHLASSDRLPEEAWVVTEAMSDVLAEWDALSLFSIERGLDASRTRRTVEELGAVPGLAAGLLLEPPATPHR